MELYLPERNHHSLIPDQIDCGMCMLRPVTVDDEGWIDALMDEDYVAENLDTLPLTAHEMTEAVEGGDAMYFAIIDHGGRRVGMIGALPRVDCDPAMPRWMIDGAVGEGYRNRGYASAALGGMKDYLFSTFTLPRLVVDVRDDNAPARRMLEKCGFQRPSCQYAYVNRRRVSHGLRYQWFALQPCLRSLLFAKGMQYYRKKKFIEAAEMWHDCLTQPHEIPSPYCDSLILGNIGMAYSSMGWYTQARQWIERAAVLAENPDYLWSELLWIDRQAGV